MLGTAKSFLYLLLASLSVAPHAWAEPDSVALVLPGYWQCDSGGCPGEAVEFALDDGVHTYNSWLHDRPSASDGHWTLQA